uniref:C2H2-type domain-containing protein n=1 Tax=Cajanus cajan TaxID=3821 RepID=A0A151R2M3_CAJCA|nr:hypothetical protein KK1_042063 [Cajanus cajan]
MMSYEERKFVCKYCSKRFPCGKSLGGHIRTHMMSEHSHSHSRSVQGNEKKNNVGGAMFSNNNIIYGLRENPKKTTRFVHSNATLQQQQQLDKFCKECGKGFPSLKALCGHMACHSEKDKNRFEGFTEKQKLVMDSQSDTETSAPRRSRRMRFKTLSNSNNNNNQSQSSSVSEVEQEQEEVARCLMMLYKDSCHKGRFALVTESSDNNSVVLEAKSSSLETKVTMMMNSTGNGKNSMSSAYEFVEEKKKLELEVDHKYKHEDMKFKSAEICYDSDNSDSGYFRYGPKKVDSDDSNDGFFRNEVKSSKVGYLSGFEEYDVESRKVLSRGRSRSTEFKKFALEDWENDGEDVAAARKFGSKKFKKSNYDQNLGGVSSRKMGNGYTNGGNNKYECLTSERDNGSDDSAYESDESSTDTDSYPAPKAHNRNISGQKGKKKLKTKKSKAHECPICNKIFRSGQALGGHKRSHFVGGSEENALVIRPGAPNVPCLIDLNLPAPVDE